MPDIEAMKQTVFFVTRIGNEGSPERQRSDDLMELLLRPVVEDFDSGLTVVRADEMATMGRITDNIIHHLEHAAYIVVDATGLNPNVFYELGVANTFRKKVVLIVDDPERIPFDTKSEAHLVLRGEGPLLPRAVQNASGEAPQSTGSLPRFPGTAWARGGGAGAAGTCRPHGPGGSGHSPQYRV